MVDIPQEGIEKLLKHYQIRGIEMSYEKLQDMLQKLATLHPDCGVEQFIADLHQMIEWESEN